MQDLDCSQLILSLTLSLMQNESSWHWNIATTSSDWYGIFKGTQFNISDVFSEQTIMLIRKKISKLLWWSLQTVVCTYIIFKMHIFILNFDDSNFFSNLVRIAEIWMASGKSGTFSFLMMLISCIKKCRKSFFCCTAIWVEFHKHFIAGRFDCVW